MNLVVQLLTVTGKVTVCGDNQRVIQLPLIGKAWAASATVGHAEVAQAVVPDAKH